MAKGRATEGTQPKLGLNNRLRNSQWYDVACPRLFWIGHFLLAKTTMLVRPCPATLRRSLARPLFTLPDLSSLSPFSEPGASPEELQTYHERKVLPYVMMSDPIQVQMLNTSPTQIST